MCVFTGCMRGRLICVESQDVCGTALSWPADGPRFESLWAHIALLKDVVQ